MSVVTGLLAYSADGPEGYQVSLRMCGSVLVDRCSWVFVRIGKWLFECIPVVLMFCYIAPESDSHRLVQAFLLAVCRRIINYFSLVFDTKQATSSCQTLGHELRAVIRREKGRDAIRYNPMIEEDGRNMRRCRFGKSDSPGRF